MHFPVDLNFGSGEPGAGFVLRALSSFQSLEPLRAEAPARERLLSRAILGDTLWEQGYVVFNLAGFEAIYGK